MPANLKLSSEVHPGTKNFFSYLSASDSLSPGGGSYWNASLWGPIWVSFYFISYHKWSFLTINLLTVSANFWPPRFFILTDGMGWMGWTDGSVEVEKNIPFANISKTTKYFFLIVLAPLEEFWRHFLWKTRKKSNFIFF